jgi:hypothetical protein
MFAFDSKFGEGVDECVLWFCFAQEKAVQMVHQPTGENSPNLVTLILFF